MPVTDAAASDERTALLDEYGYFYGDEHFAIAFTAGIAGDKAKRVTTAAWDKTPPLAGGDFGAGLLSQRGLQRNPVVVLRPSNLIVLECDSEPDLVAIQALELPITLTVRSSERYKRHFYFRPAPELEALPYVAFRFESGKLTADSGRYFLCPPALHPSGHTYAFLPDLGPGDVDIAELPERTYRDLAQQAREEDRSQRDRIAIDPEAKIRAGNRRDMLFRYGCMLRRWGLQKPEILAACIEFNERRCDPPIERHLVEVQVDGAMKYDAGAELTAVAEPSTLRIVPLTDFISVEDDVVEPLIGSADETLLPVNGMLLMYGDGGAGKTTLSVDALAHVASATSWLGLPIPNAVKVVLIENEGPRGPFRQRLAKKVATWAGGAFAPNVSVLEEPWSQFTLGDATYRTELAQEIERLQADLVIIGPLASIGARGGGTPDEISEFDKLIRDLRSQCSRPFALWIVHHENKAGDVSGAWERLPDSLVHVQAQGNGRTRVFWRKVRWSSALHQTSSNLIWGDDYSFEIEQKPVVDVQGEIAGVLSNGEWHLVPDIARTLQFKDERVRNALRDMERARIVERISPAPGRKANSVGWRLCSSEEDGTSRTSRGYDPVSEAARLPVRPYKGRTGRDEDEQGDELGPNSGTSNNQTSMDDIPF